MGKISMKNGFINKLGILFGFCFLMPAYMLGQIPAPGELSVELLTNPESTVIRDLNPEFGWVVQSSGKGLFQSACQVQVKQFHSGKELFDIPFIWDSEKVETPLSVNFEYQGQAFLPGVQYAWRVRIWDQEGRRSEWSEFQQFRTADRTGAYEVSTYPLETRFVKAVQFFKSDERFFYDFGRAAFGTVRIEFPPLEKNIRLEIHFAEKLSGENTLDSNPPGSIRYRETSLEVGKGVRWAEVAIPSDLRNTRPGAILMPDYIGEVTPFRYCEILISEINLEKDSVVMKAANYPFNDQASEFVSGNSLLNKVWDFCKYSIKATSFLGIYVDGDRERIAYEADAYINQLGHYLVDREYSMARATHEYLMRNPTWPTEWILHSVLMAWEDYMYTGNLESAEFYYEDLKKKTLNVLADQNGLISTAGNRVGEDILKSVYLKSEMKDIVDWPPGSFTQGGTGERDGHEMVEFNTVVNAFHYRALVLISRLAEALGETGDVSVYRERASLVKEAFNDLLLDSEKGIYRDGIGTDHSSLHSNMFPLAFGLVPDEFKESVTGFVKSRGMACSVYGSQYLLDALYSAGEDQAAFSLLTAEHDRGWLNMLKSGSTITLEAWDLKYKNNLDWNHAWGAAPANLIPRWILGVQPLKPGFEEILISPHPGGLDWARGRVPTIRGTVFVEFLKKNNCFELEVEIPANVKARVKVPAGEIVFLDDSEVSAAGEGDRMVLTPGPGRHRIRVERIDN
jgi:alpha-L-rhamnosidase